MKPCKLYRWLAQSALAERFNSAATLDPLNGWLAGVADGNISREDQTKLLERVESDPDARTAFLETLADALLSGTITREHRRWLNSVLEEHPELRARFRQDLELRYLLRDSFRGKRRARGVGNSFDPRLADLKPRMDANGRQ